MFLLGYGFFLCLVPIFGSCFLCVASMEESKFVSFGDEKIKSKRILIKVTTIMLTKENYLNWYAPLPLAFLDDESMSILLGISFL